MSERDESVANRTYSHFRSTLDLGMGFIYVLIGALILYLKYFGTMELSAGYAYVLGGLMEAYGVFRIYRGIVSLKNVRRRRS